MVKRLKLVLLFSCLIPLCSVGNAQENSGSANSGKKLKLNLGADLVSRYVWRGTDFGNSPAIQPTLSLSGKNLEIGCWSSVSTNNSLREIDLFAIYSIRNFSLMVTDYYVPETNGLPAAPDIRYFAFNDKNTAHSLEASLQYKGDENFPISLIGGVFVYGNDKRWGYDSSKDSTSATYYSTYFEAGYTLVLQDNNLDFFVGITPGAGAYGPRAGFVNLGITAYRTIRISETFELPVKGSLVLNPQASNVFFVLGITI